MLQFDTPKTFALNVQSLSPSHPLLSLLYNNSDLPLYSIAPKDSIGASNGTSEEPQEEEEESSDEEIHVVDSEGVAGVLGEVRGDEDSSSEEEEEESEGGGASISTVSVNCMTQGVRESPLNPNTHA